jgi:hypothetical protein
LCIIWAILTPLSLQFPALPPILPGRPARPRIAQLPAGVNKTTINPAPPPGWPGGPRLGGASEAWTGPGELLADAPAGPPPGAADAGDVPTLLRPRSVVDTIVGGGAAAAARPVRPRAHLASA